MPRPPKEPFFPPDDPRLKQPLPGIESVPWPVFEGIIRGLLAHSWPRRDSESDLEQATIERKMRELAYEATRLEQETLPIRNEEFSNWLATRVSLLLQSLVKLTPLVLAQDKSLILKALRPYADCRDFGERERWLTDNLPRILESLKKDRSTSPVNYKQRTSLPPARIIKEWAAWRGQTEICHFILGWRYGQKPNGLASKTIKNILDTQT